MRVRSALLVAALLIVACLPPHRVTQAQVRGESFSCVVAVSTATSLTAIAAPCTDASHPNRSMYVTDISMSTNAGGIAGDSFSTLKYGTGTTCGTGTTIFWFAMTPAATQTTVFEAFTTPIRLPPGVDICWINSTAGSRTWVINGFLGP